MKSYTYKMAATFLLTLFVNVAQAAFLTPGTEGRIELLSGCSTFGNCGNGHVDNIFDNGGSVNGLGGVAGDGLVGFIDFTMIDGNNFSITNYSQDTQHNTAIGSKGVGAASTMFMNGSFSDTGDVIIDPTGRVLAGSFIPFTGIVEWNRDDSLNPNFSTTGLYNQFTSGTALALNPATGEQEFSLTGESLTSTGHNEWVGTIVMAGNIGKGWGPFDSTPFSESFSIRVVASPVPVPAAIWLFFSGTICLTGMARRKKA